MLRIRTKTGSVPLMSVVASSTRVARDARHFQREDPVGVNRQAEKAAEDLLGAAWLADGQSFSSCPIPVDPFAIASRLGLVVARRPLEPDVSGMLAKTPNRDPEVFINALD